MTSKYCEAARPGLLEMKNVAPAEALSGQLWTLVALVAAFAVGWVPAFQGSLLTEKSMARVCDAESAALGTVQVSTCPTTPTVPVLGVELT